MIESRHFSEEVVIGNTNTEFLTEYTLLERTPFAFD